MRRHSTDTLSLVFGLLFTALAAWWALAKVTDDVDLPLAWLAVGTLMVIGVVGVVTSVRRPPSPGPTDPPPDPRAPAGRCLRWHH